ncbi:MAG: von Willebrand factor type A domain-containing protein [Anaerolineales bacterium]|nr:von Willebrand factor type A domain-containing protein [Anaerolineales bacterium]
MFTLRKVFGYCAVFLLLFLAACGGAPAATEAPAYEPQVYDLAPAATEGSYSAEEISPSFVPQSSGQPSASNEQEEPYDMFFQDYGVNPSIDTEDDNLSTFALDVDTGSYTVMRNYINDGYLPPEDSVRVEEYVNYFDQGYENPSAHQAFGIYVDGGPSPFTQTERYDMIRIGIQGYDIPKSERKDAALTFVIDVSGSMDMDNRLGLVKQSLEMLVEQLHEDDTVSIVVYGSEARVVLEPTRGSNAKKILSAIHRLEPEGATNAEAGLRLGYRMAMEAYKRDGINRVILCSDGVANVGETGPDAILDEINHYVEEGVTLTTVGFGMDNYNDTLMEQLADNGNGFYAYVDDRSEARKLFVDEITGTLQTIALDAKVQVEFNPDVVRSYRLVGYENRAVADEDFRNNKVDAGEIGAGHSVTALYEVKLLPEAYGKIATVYMRWEDPDTHEVVEISKGFDVEQLARDFHGTSPYFQRAVIVAEYAEVLKGSYWAEDSSLDDVYEEATSRGISDWHDDDWDEFVELVRMARKLD